jgi:hypothetical protein
MLRVIAGAGQGGGPTLAPGRHRTVITSATSVASLGGSMALSRNSDGLGDRYRHGNPPKGDGCGLFEVRVRR